MMYQTRRDLPVLLAALAARLAGTAQGAPPTKVLAVNRVRLLPSRGHETAMLHGTICGSNVSSQAGFAVLAEVKSVPESGRWVELIYCGVISVRPGMTLKAVAYRSGMADSAREAAIYPKQ